MLLVVAQLGVIHKRQRAASASHTASVRAGVASNWNRPPRRRRRSRSSRGQLPGRRTRTGRGNGRGDDRRGTQSFRWAGRQGRSRAAASRAAAEGGPARHAAAAAEAWCRIHMPSAAAKVGSATAAAETWCGTHSSSATARVGATAAATARVGAAATAKPGRSVIVLRHGWGRHCGGAESSSRCNRKYGLMHRFLHLERDVNRPDGQRRYAQGVARITRAKCRGLLRRPAMPRIHPGITKFPPQDGHRALRPRARGWQHWCPRETHPGQRSHGR